MHFNNVILQCQAQSIRFQNKEERISLFIHNLKSAAINHLNASKIYYNNSKMVILIIILWLSVDHVLTNF